MAPPGRDIEIIIDQDDPLEKKFHTAPNALHRGEQDLELNYDFRGMTLRGRAMLAALASMRTGWKCNRRRIEALAPELGRDALDAVLWELRSRGHLRIVQDNGDRGAFVYRWGISVRGRADWAEAEIAEKGARRRRAGFAADNVISISAGQAVPGFSGHGPDSNDSDKTRHGLPGHGSPGHGSPGLGSSPTGKKEQGVEDLGEEPPTPPTPTADTAAAVDAEAARGEEILQQQQQAAALVLDNVIGAVPAHRRPKGTARADMLAALTAELAAGWPVDALSDALSGSFVGATSVAKVLAARLRNVGPPPAPRLPAGSLAGRPADDGSGDHLLAEGRLDADTAKQLIAAALAKRKAS